MARHACRLLAAVAILGFASPAQAWWNNSWGLRRKITFNNSGQITNLVTFPVLIRLDSSRVEYFRTQNLGQDIRFVDADDATILNHEIELWNESGSSYVWVRVPQINAASTNDFIYMYYDNPAALDGQNQAGVWDASFMMVQHLSETSGTHFDSTSNNNDSVVIDVAAQGSAAGQIDGADNFTGTHNIDVGDSGSLDMAATDSFTVEGWINTTAGGFQVVVSKEEDLASEYQLWVDNGTATFWLRDGTDDALVGGTPVANGAWRYLVGRWNEASSTAEIFVDGTSVGSVNQPALDAMSSPNPLVIGEEGDLNRGGNFNGRIDEVRVSKVARSNDWIRAQNLSMRDTFATFAPADSLTCCQPLAVTLASGTITVTAPNAFEQVFADAAGGHVRDFYDLAESPVRDPVHDLVGGINNQDGLFMDELDWTVDGFNYRSDKDPNLSPARASLLEATATRVLVRSQSPYARPFGGGLVLGGVKAVGDWSVYPSGRMALHWKRMTTSAIDTGLQQLHLNVHYQGAAPLNGWAGFTQSGPICLTACSGPAADDFVLLTNEQPGARTDFLTILEQDWANASQTYADFNLAQEWLENTWYRTPNLLIPAGTTETWNFLTYFKPTIFTGNTDPAVTSRNADYQTPDNLALPAPPVAGAGWFDPAESTVSPSDFFNEKEAAYALDFDPITGLTFDMDGATTPRYHPFLKIRQWRSLAPPSTITLEGVTLTRDVDFRADLMPISRASMQQDLLWYSTLQNPAAVTSPDVGSAGSLVGGISFGPARLGDGARVNASGDWIAVPTSGNFVPATGRIAFWYRPNYDSADGVHHDICGFVDGSGDLFVVEKRSDNNLYFRINTAGGLPAGNSELQVNSANYTWRAGEWVHFRLTWDDTAPLGTQQRLHINDIEPTNVNPTVDYDSTLLSVAPDLRFGNTDGDGTFAPGDYDEIDIVRAATQIANAGLVGSPSEFLADPANNFTLDFAGVDPQGRGRYFFPAATAKFRGLNISFVTPGAGVAPGALEWEYWNGTGWTSLESVAGFTDQTNSLTRAGTVFWTADPPGWVPYSLSGGLDLYRLRVHLPAGSSYTTLPVEWIIKTDVLFLQYCGDITLDSQTFGIAPPIPTAVELASFQARGLDGAVELTWETASELKNLGFYLYRAVAPGGPYERITASAIPGLGSSPQGARYRYVDSGLANGTTYFYQLEDIETTGKTKRHGPVSAVPERADANGPQPTRPPAGSTSEVVYGNPSAVFFRELERTAQGVLLELVTEGFTAEVEEGGSVQLSIPGFSEVSQPGTPAIPVKRGWVEVRAGWGVRLASARVEGVEVFESLRPVAAGTPELIASRRGTVRPSRRRATEGAAFRAPGLYPEETARLIEVGYQGEAKKALVEISPLRWDGASGQLVLARRLVVRLVFAGAEEQRHGESRSHTRAGVIKRLVTREEGLYGVSFEELMGAGAREVSTSRLRLARLGEAVAFHVEPDPRIFAPASVLYFLSEGGALNPYGREAAYELEASTGGERMERTSGAPRGAAVSFYGARVEQEENRYYQAGLLEASDLWLWDLLLAPSLKSYPFSATEPVSVSEPARLSLWLQGVSDAEASPDHHLRLSVNGVWVAEMSFEGKKPLALTVDLPAGTLREGENSVEIQNVGDTGAPYSMVMLDRFAVSYPRRLVAEGGGLRGGFSESGAAEVEGLSANALVVEVTGRQPKWLQGMKGTGRGLTFSVEAGREYLAVSREAVLKPEVRKPSAVTLKSSLNRADYLVVGPKALLGAAKPLLELRRSQGLKSRAVAIEQVYEEFGYGESRPEAVRELLSYAYHHWRKPAPRYVLLLGDASYDYKDYLGTGVRNQVPTFLLKSSYLWTASDWAYGSVNGEDLLPDMAMGRMPAATVDEARVMVEKVLAYESTSHGVGRAVLVADNPDTAGDFEADAEELASGVLAARNPLRVYLSRLGAEPTRRAIVEAFDGGAALVSYLGHGGIHLWAQENIFNTSEVGVLSAQSEQPLVLTLNCLNGYFHFPYFNSLAEELLKAEGKGAVAAFSPSGLSLNEPAHLFHKALLSELMSGKHQRLGDAVAAAQAAYASSGAFPELLSIYHLLGDPALSLR